MTSTRSTFFVSGHRDISQEEFEEHYVPGLERALYLGSLTVDGVGFVVGDSYGVDAMAQAYLKDRTTNVTVYHIKEHPFNNAGNFPTQGGFPSHNKKDAAMTMASDQDIAWIRSDEGQRKLYGAKYRPRVSGTERNIIRRSKAQM